MIPAARPRVSFEPISLKKSLLRRGKSPDSFGFGGGEDLEVMDKQAAPAKLLYDFEIESHVPGDHLLRQVDRFLDLGDIRARLQPFYSHLGRPTIDPELIVRMLLIGYLTGIRSERRLCEEVHLNLAYR